MYGNENVMHKNECSNTEEKPLCGPNGMRFLRLQSDKISRQVATTFKREMSFQKLERKMFFESIIAHDK